MADDGGQGAAVAGKRDVVQGKGRRWGRGVRGNDLRAAAAMRLRLRCGVLRRRLLVRNDTHNHLHPLKVAVDHRNPDRLAIVVGGLFDLLGE